MLDNGLALGPATTVSPRRFGLNGTARLSSSGGGPLCYAGTVSGATAGSMHYAGREPTACLSAVVVNVRVDRTAARLRAAADRQGPVGQGGTGETGKRQKRLRLTNFGGGERKSGVAGGSLAVRPGQGEVAGGNTEQRNRIPHMKVVDRAPSRRRRAGVQKERVRPAATG